MVSIRLETVVRAVVLRASSIALDLEELLHYYGVGGCLPAVVGSTL